uniref:Uncharacterized protein n=2 Tax=unclassified Caudoviricetes TaxID=2788787 RepID=A0A8S5VAZ3_9CAUD|nr:MAG TPA: hypothetical protein [Siphoviridae sp. ctfrT39]DAG03885.1 MAG TPA: hypothetical protein [Siphoviridae sp. ct0vA12]
MSDIFYKLNNYYYSLKIVEREFNKQVQNYEMFL